VRFPYWKFAVTLVPPVGTVTLQEFPVVLVHPFQLKKLWLLPGVAVSPT